MTQGIFGIIFLGMSLFGGIQGAPTLPRDASVHDPLLPRAGNTIVCDGRERTTRKFGVPGNFYEFYQCHGRSTLVTLCPEGLMFSEDDQDCRKEEDIIHMKQKRDESIVDPNDPNVNWPKKMGPIISLDEASDNWVDNWEGWSSEDDE